MGRSYLGSMGERRVHEAGRVHGMERRERMMMMERRMRVAVQEMDAGLTRCCG